MFCLEFNTVLFLSLIFSLPCSVQDLKIVFISLLINAHRNNEDQVVVKDFGLNTVTDIAFIVRTVGTEIKWLIHSFFVMLYEYVSTAFATE